MKADGAEEYKELGGAISLHLQTYSWKVFLMIEKCYFMICRL